ncbi:MAG: dephospho-CoA kinase [Bacteroidetes bacterium]|nr:dephospho-CoA kinase [Bacteroidota bacterium]
MRTVPSPSHTPKPPYSVTTLGITGGIGSGKSTVAALLGEKLRVRIVSADDEARRLMVEDEELRTALIERFGADTFLEDGSLNRAELATRVFGDPEEVEALNAIVHPAVREELGKSIRQAEKDGIDLFAYEAALIYEIGANDLVDAVLLVDAPLELRINRVMQRDGSTRSEVVARMSNQISSDVLRARADFVIDNDGDLAALQDSVDSLYRSILDK